MTSSTPETRKRVFIYEFAWTEKLIRHIIKSCKEKGLVICGWGVRSKDIERVKSVWSDAPIYRSTMPEDLNLINFAHNLLETYNFEEEETIKFLLDRERDYQNNLDSNLARYKIHAWVMTVLELTKPDWLLFSDVPHNVFTYLLYLQGKQIGIESFMIRFGPAPHLFSISKNIARELALHDSSEMDTEPSKQTKNYLSELTTDNDISPVYMIKQRKNTKPLTVAKRTLQKGLNLFSKKSLSAIKTYYKRWKLRKYYESVSELKPDMDKPYIVLFLHLQPERTTIPEGGVFAQQWLIAQMLSTICAPLGWNIYIKEHPSTFMFGPKLYRGNWFYDSLNLLSGVKLVSTSLDSSYLVKNSKAVATVTGTIGIEAVTKGVPVLFFGESSYLGLTGTFRVTNLQELEEAISIIANGVDIRFEDIKMFYVNCEKDVHSYNSGLPRMADHGDRWSKGIPQTFLFSKMLEAIERENNINTPNFVSNTK